VLNAKRASSWAEEWLASRLAGRRGIVVCKVGGWAGATGQFTLWDGTNKTLAYAALHDNPDNALYYFLLTERRDLKNGARVLIQPAFREFRELK
jgi:hypothetical protein